MGGKDKETKMTDEGLVEELKNRLDEKNMALTDLKAVTKNLETVNKKLQESEKLKTDFLSNIRNEINNPLTVMVALSGELATIKPSDSKKYVGVAQMLHKEAIILDFQIRNILSAAELEAGESYLHVTKVNVQSIIDECLNSFSPLIDELGLQIKRKGPSPMWVNTDSDKLFMAISNLISNGIVFNSEGGALEIIVSQSNDTFICSIKDDGIGIDEGDQNIIFDRFKQVDMGTRKKYRGHGLGLSVAAACVDLMDGSISIESAKGKGSTFTLVVRDRAEEEAEGVSTEGVELFMDEDGEEQEF